MKQGQIACNSARPRRERKRDANNKVRLEKMAAHNAKQAADSKKAKQA